MRASTDAVAREMSPESANSRCPLVAELTLHVKENSRSGIVSCLTRIKSDPKCFRRLLDNGGVCLLVELLRYRNVKVLDTTLSILANACLCSHIRDEVQETKIAAYTVWILKNLQSGDTMHCRACRLIGNLSESGRHAKALCDAGAIFALTEMVSSKTNAQTLAMAVRAVRNIWNVYEGSREEILEAGTIKSITALLVQSKKKLLERDDDAKYVELSESCLKAMYVFVASGDSRPGEQMRGEKGLHGYRCIVEHCRANNKTAMKCLYKLCRNAERRPDLGCSGAIECLVEVVRGSNHHRSSSGTSRARNSTSSPSCSWESLISLSLFCREAVNRAKIRSGSGLEVILGRLTEVHNEKYHPMLLNALAQFLCDDQSIAIMVKNGLVDVLVHKLKKMTLETKAAEGIERGAKFGKKRSAETSPTGVADAKYKRSDRFGRFSLDYPRSNWSPGSTSNGCSSPSNSPPLSPQEMSSNADENAEDNYSPICSDNEWLDNEDSTEAQDGTESSARTRGDGDEESKEPEETDNSDKDKCEDVEDDEQPSSSNEEIREQAAHVWTLALLSMLSYSSEPIDGLAEPATIRALVAYIDKAKHYRACVILTRIVRNRAYFVPLLLQGFVFEAQTLYGTEQYTRALCEIAETGGAFGNLATILLRGQESQRFIVALSIPFMIKSREKLRVLLNNHGGLDLIFRVLEEPSHSLYDEAILAICKLAVSLGVSGPEKHAESLETTFERSRITECENNEEQQLVVDTGTGDDETSSECVTFELDDGSTVETRRTILCEKSEVFSAMLKGSFNEAGKSRVRLRNASNDGLLTLLSAASGEHGLHGGRKIEALLDAVLLADQFLMPDLSEHLTETSIARLTHDNLSSAWNWSRKNSCQELETCCVKMFLAAPMTPAQRLGAFRDFSNSPSFGSFVEDVRLIIGTSLAASRA